MTLKTQMEKIIHTTYNNIGGIVVLKDGKVVYETYLNQFTPETTVHVFSVTKSITSVLIGIAIDKGYVQSTKQKILDFFPEYTVQKQEKIIQNITLENILTMTAPYRFKEEPYAEFFSSSDWVKSSLDFIGGNGSIGTFRYAGVIGPDILTGILAHATHQPVLDFAKEHIFDPMNIYVPNSIVFHNKEEQLDFYKSKNVKGWVADPKGINTGGWGLNLTPRDMASIGQMYLNKGTWEGKQLVPALWISESTKKHSSSGKLGYGYLWWIIDEREHCYAAMGDGGNVIYINEKKNMVIAIGSLFIPNAKDRLKLIRDYMEKVF